VKKPPAAPPAYRRLQKQLARIGYLSQGSVLQRSPGQQGSPYIWTRKIKRKTVTVALSEAQFKRLRQAVANRRLLDKIVSQMQVLSRKQIFENVPGVTRRKQLNKKVLGLI
jgi:virulence-associated protein VapD